jgi:dTDP-4-dehydrorhamnose 3,5-epimerase
MKKIEHNIPGLYTLSFDEHKDVRGSFVKIFNNSLLSDLDLFFDIKEQFYNRSCRGVIRGMHLQAPPKDPLTIVQCIEGSIRDIVIDLRIGSPTYLQTSVNYLNWESPVALLIPAGLAHGFEVDGEYATVLYSRSVEYAPSLDIGIRWNSFGMDWKCKHPLVSPRDSSLPALDSFLSPFHYLG